MKKNPNDSIKTNAHSQLQKTNLQKMLNDSNQLDEETSIEGAQSIQSTSPKAKANSGSSEILKNEKLKEKSLLTSNKAIVVPDTCSLDLFVAESNPSPIAAVKISSVRSDVSKSRFQPNKLIVRDTIDSDDFLNLFIGDSKKNQKLKTSDDLVDIEEEHSKSDDRENEQRPKELTKIIVENENDILSPNKFGDDMTTNTATNALISNICKRASLTKASTPLLVKKKLQEHGLLDLSHSSSSADQESPNDVEKSQSIFAKANTNNSAKPAQRDQNTALLNTSSPIKYIQRTLSQSSELGGSSSTSSLGVGKSIKAAKTPPRVASALMSVKSTPSKSPSIFSKSTSIDDEAKRAKKNSRADDDQDSQKNDETLDFSFEFRNETSKKASKANKKDENKQRSSTNSSKNALSVKENADDVSSPKSSKRFKQLTMTQAFVSQLENSERKLISKKSQSSFEKIKEQGHRAEAFVKDSNETCLPETDIENDIVSLQADHVF
jgi:hypothetical protein